jgi:hypothetical protein
MSGMNVPRNTKTPRGAARGTRRIAQQDAGEKAIRCRHQHDPARVAGERVPRGFTGDLPAGARVLGKLVQEPVPHLGSGVDEEDGTEERDNEDRENEDNGADRGDDLSSHLGGIVLNPPHRFVEASVDPLGGSHISELERPLDRLEPVLDLFDAVDKLC